MRTFAKIIVKNVLITNKILDNLKNALFLILNIIMKKK